MTTFPLQESEFSLDFDTTTLYNCEMVDRGKNHLPIQISNWLSGDRRMHEDTILFFCSALGIRWQDLDVQVELPAKNPRIERLKARIESLEGIDDDWLEEAETMILQAIRIAKRSQEKYGKKKI